jgi:hypothetical protein
MAKWTRKVTGFFLYFCKILKQYDRNLWSRCYRKRDVVVVLSISWVSIAQALWMSYTRVISIDILFVAGNAAGSVSKFPHEREVWATHIAITSKDKVWSMIAARSRAEPWRRHYSRCQTAQLFFFPTVHVPDGVTGIVRPRIRSASLGSTPSNLHVLGGHHVSQTYRPPMAVLPPANRRQARVAEFVIRHDQDL